MCVCVCVDKSMSAKKASPMRGCCLEGGVKEGFVARLGVVTRAQARKQLVQSVNQL